MRSNSLRWGLVALLGSTSILTAQAQDVYMDMFNSANQAAVSMALNNVNIAAVNAASHNAVAKHSATGAASSSARLAYTPTAALRQQTVRELSSKLQANNPAAGQAFAQAFGPGKTDYNQLFREMVKASGLPADNAATAFAAYLEIAYIIVNNVQNSSSITPAMDRAVQRQAVGLLSQNKGLSSPAAVAKFGEATKLQAIVLYLGWQSARKSGQAEQFRTTIAQQFRSQGLDMSAVRLTTQGLVRK